MLRKFLNRLCLLAAVALATPAHASIENPTIAEIDAVLAAVRDAYRAAIPGGNDRPAPLNAGDVNADDDTRIYADRLIRAAFETRGERGAMDQVFMVNERAPQSFDADSRRPVAPRAVKTSVINRAVRGVFDDVGNRQRRLRRQQPTSTGLNAEAEAQAAQIAALTDRIEAFGRIMQRRSRLRDQRGEIRPSIATAANLASRALEEVRAQFQNEGRTVSVKDTAPNRSIELSPNMTVSDLNKAMELVENALNTAAREANVDGDASGEASDASGEANRVTPERRFETMLALANIAASAISDGRGLGRGSAQLADYEVLNEFTEKPAMRTSLSGDNARSLAALGARDLLAEDNDYADLPDSAQSDSASAEDNALVQQDSEGNFASQDGSDGYGDLPAFRDEIPDGYDDIPDLRYDSESPRASSSSASRVQGNRNDDRSSSERDKENAEQVE